MAKKIVRLSEKDMTRLITKIIKEELGEKPKFTDFGGPAHPNWEDEEETKKYFDDATKWAGSEDYGKYREAHDNWQKSRSSQFSDELSKERIAELERTIMNAQNELNRLRGRNRRG